MSAAELKAEILAVESAVSVAVAAVGAWAAEDLFPIVIFSGVERAVISRGAVESGAEAVKTASALGAVTVAAVLVWPPGAGAMCVVVGLWAA